VQLGLFGHGWKRTSRRGTLDSAGLWSQYPDNHAIPGSADNPRACKPPPNDYYNPLLLANLQTALPQAFKQFEDTPIVPQTVYNAAGYTPAPALDTYSRIQDTSLTFTPYNAAAPITMQQLPKTIQELFDPLEG